MKISHRAIISILVIICLFAFCACEYNNRIEDTEGTNITYETFETIVPTEDTNDIHVGETTQPETQPTERPTEEEQTEPTEEPTYEVIVPETTTPSIEEEQGQRTVSLGEFRLTAYCPCEICNGKWAGGITATGVMAQANHTIAVDPKVIPYGSKVIINGCTYTAEDCGGAIKGNRIDIFFNTHEEANEFGVQYAEVFLIIEE